MMDKNEMIALMAASICGPLLAHHVNGLTGDVDPGEAMAAREMAIEQATKLYETMFD